MTDAIAWATAHPYETFALLLGLFILYAKVIYPKEWHR